MLETGDRIVKLSTQLGKLPFRIPRRRIADTAVSHARREQ